MAHAEAGRWRPADSLREADGPAAAAADSAVPYNSVGGCVSGGGTGEAETGPLWPMTADHVRLMDEVKREYAARALELHAGNVAATARALGIANAPMETGARNLLRIAVSPNHGAEAAIAFCSDAVGYPFRRRCLGVPLRSMLPPGMYLEFQFLSKTRRRLTESHAVPCSAPTRSQRMLGPYVPRIGESALECSARQSHGVRFTQCPC